MALVETTKGPIEASALNRTVIVEDRPDMLALIVRYQLPNGSDALGAAKYGEVVRQDAFPFPKTRPDADGALLIERGGARSVVAADTLKRVVTLTDTPNDIAVAVEWFLNGELVKRDCNVVVLEGGVEAQVIAATLAG